MGEVAYKLKLPERLKSHLTFHVSFLKPYFADVDDLNKNWTKRTPPSISTQFNANIKEILDQGLWEKAKRTLRLSS